MYLYNTPPLEFPKREKQAVKRSRRVSEKQCLTDGGVRALSCARKNLLTIRFFWWSIFFEKKGMDFSKHP
jgi:hypothetical protein